MVPLLPKLFGTSGVRGVFPDRVNPELMIRVGRAIAQYFNRSSLVVGHDARTSSKALSLALTSSLISSGASVVDLGLTPIGVLAWSVKKFNLGGGIYITASHNPPQYNGFKVFKRGGVEITTVDEEIIEENLDRASYASWSELGRYSTLNPLEDYVSELKSSLSVQHSRYKPKVILDTANGPTVLVAPRILTDIGASILVVNGDIDGRFPGRHPEPRPDVLEPLLPVLSAVGFDALFAFDGDGDRLSVVTPNRGFIKQDRIIALFAQRILSERRGVVVVSVDCGNAVRKVVEDAGGKMVLYKLGKTHEGFLKYGNTVLAAEPWKVIDPRWGLWIDGIYQAAYLTKLMMEEGKNLEHILNRIPDFPQARCSIAVPEDLKAEVYEEVVEAMKSRYSEKAEITEIDGLRIDFEDSSWILIRQSGTEPKIRLYAEAADIERLRSLVNSVLNLVLSSLSSRGVKPHSIEKSILP
ncbi:MAG: hypothetical protein QW130_05185 [Sulfolobales archaeon]